MGFWNLVWQWRYYLQLPGIVTNHSVQPTIPMFTHWKGMYGYQSWTRTSDNGRKPPGCCAVRHTCQSLPAAWVSTCRIALSASTCRVHFAYFNASHFSQPRYHHRAKGCRQESAGVCHVLGSPVQIWWCWYFEPKILHFYFVSRGFIYKKYMKICTIRKFPAMWYSPHISG